MSKVDLQRISPGTIRKGGISFDLFAMRAGRLVLFCRKGFEITDHHIESLARHNLSYFIRHNDFQKYLSYAQDNIEKLIEDPDVKAEVKAQAVHSLNRKRMDTILRDPYSDEANEKSRKIVDNYLRMLVNEPSASNNLLALASLDAYTYSHALNVCSLAMMMGQEMFPADKKKLFVLGFAGLMHDIGKTKISDDIIRKNDTLTEEEFLVIKKHTIFSEEIIDHHGHPKVIAQAARSHHEKYCGGGYPDNLYGNQIPWIARLIAVVDVYDALTSRRSYKREIRNLEALKLMHNESKSFDQHIFGCLMKVVLRSNRLVKQFASENKILSIAS